MIIFKTSGETKSLACFRPLMERLILSYQYAPPILDSHLSVLLGFYLTLLFFFFITYSIIGSVLPRLDSLKSVLRNMYSVLATLRGLACLLITSF